MNINNLYVEIDDFLNNTMSDSKYIDETFNVIYLHETIKSFRLALPNEEVLENVNNIITKLSEQDAHFMKLSKLFNPIYLELKDNILSEKC